MKLELLTNATAVDDAMKTQLIKKDLRVINQPHVPQNAIVNMGTTVTRLDADAMMLHWIGLLA